MRRKPMRPVRSWRLTNQANRRSSAIGFLLFVAFILILFKALSWQREHLSNKDWVRLIDTHANFLLVVLTFASALLAAGVAIVLTRSTLAEAIEARRSAIR